MPEESPPEEPRWEQGYRCHGYWIGPIRLGLVSLSPRAGTALPAGEKYGWDFFPGGRVSSQSKAQRGRCHTLREGKRIVERLYCEYLEERVRSGAGHA